MSETSGLSVMQRLTRNTLWLLLQSAVGRLISFALNILLARYLGAAGYGELAFAVAFVGFFTVFGDFGLSLYTVKEVSAKRETAPEAFTSGLVVSVLLSVLVAALIIAAGLLLKIDSRLLLVICLMGFSYILRNIGIFFGSFLRAYERMSTLAFVELMYKASLLVFCAACVLFKAGLAAIAAGYLAAEGLYLALMAGRVLGFIRPAPLAAVPDYRGLLRKILPYGLSALTVTVYFNADIVMLSFLKDKQAVGLYSVAYTLFLAAGVFSSVYFSAVFPVLSRLFNSSKEGLKKAHEKTFKFLLIAGLPISFGGPLLSGKIIGLFYGPGFSGSAAPYAVLSSMTVVTFLNAFMGHFLAATDRVKDSFRMLGLSCLLNVTLNFLFIPRFGCLGAAAATVISEIVFFVLSMNALRGTAYYTAPWKLAGRLLAYCGLMTAALLALPGLNLFLSVLLGMLVYSLCIFSSGTLTGEDRALLREAMKR